MPNDSLDKLIKSDPEIPNPTKYIILLGIAKGMEYLHSLGIIHRDLKPANVLLDENFYPYIGDFGEAKVSELTKTAILMNSYKGTPAFMAPEIFSDEDYDYKVDVFSYAILMYTLVTSKEPFPGYTSIFRMQNDISKGKRPNLTYIENRHLKAFLTKCWSQNAEERPTFDQIVEELKDIKFIEAFEANTKEVTKYLKLFDDKCTTSDKNHREKKDIKTRADTGDKSAMFKYALMLQHGDGIPVNKTEAVKYYKMAIEKRCKKAMLNYVLMLKRGVGIPVNKTEAVKYFKMAIEKRCKKAMFN